MDHADLVTAVDWLAERLLPCADQDVALSTWSRRERAIELLYAALRKAVLIAWVEIAPGKFAQLTGIDWTTASLWHEIILGGFVLSRPPDPIKRHEGLKVVLDKAALGAWRPEPVNKPPTTDESPTTSRWGPLHETGKKVLVKLAELEAAGEKINDLDEEGERLLRLKLTRATGAPHQTITRILAQFREGRRPD
jgi:hypothetical protein